ncbi:MAG: OadG family protein [Candidatus Marinimicrobia bacterium]|nr:OadG family protein [Candidatus Neomarinimicrobiota bacterium]
MDMSLFGEGLLLVVAGMASVFAFLALLVGVMHGAAAVFARWAHLFPEPPTPQPHLKSLTADQSEIAAVMAAIKAYLQ